MHGVEINTRAYVATRLLLRWDYLYAVALKTKVFGDYNHARLEVSWITSTRGLLLRGYTGVPSPRRSTPAMRKLRSGAERQRLHVFRLSFIQSFGIDWLLTAAFMAISCLLGKRLVAGLVRQRLSVQVGSFFRNMAHSPVAKKSIYVLCPEVSDFRDQLETRLPDVNIIEVKANGSGTSNWKKLWACRRPLGSNEDTHARTHTQARSQGVRKGGYILRGSGGAPPEKF